MPHSLSDVITDQNARAGLNLNLRKDISDTFRVYVRDYTLKVFMYVQTSKILTLKQLPT